MIEGARASLPTRISVKPKDAPTRHVAADICVVGAGISSGAVVHD
ncbi:MAG: hypothetical protein ABR953_05920 [Candidatus Acidiferrales bacterium]